MSPEIVVAFLTGIIGPILILLVKQYLDNHKKADPLSEAVTNAEIINDGLEELLVRFNADRIWIIQFHNGGHFYPTGKSIQKFSMVYEIVQNATDSVRKIFQNIPVSFCSRAINQVLQNDYICIPDYSNPATATFGLKYLAEDVKAKSSYWVGINTIDGKLIGILGLEYTRHTRALTSSEITDLRIETSTIGGLLIQHLK